MLEHRTPSLAPLAPLERLAERPVRRAQPVAQQLGGRAADEILRRAAHKLRKRVRHTLDREVRVHHDHTPAQHGDEPSRAAPRRALHVHARHHVARQPERLHRPHHLTLVVPHYTARLAHRYVLAVRTVEEQRHVVRGPVLEHSTFHQAGPALEERQAVAAKNLVARYPGDRLRAIADQHEAPLGVHHEDRVVRRRDQPRQQALFTRARRMENAPQRRFRIRGPGAWHPLCRFGCHETSWNVSFQS